MKNKKISIILIEMDATKIKMDIDDTSELENEDTSNLDIEQINIKEMLSNAIDNDTCEFEDIEYKEYKEFFSRISYNNVKYKDWAFCKTCKMLISTTKHSKKPLERHIKSENHRKKLNTKEKNFLITSFLRQNIKTDKKESAKKEFGKMLARMCSIDIEPFNIVNKKGFKEALQFTLDFCARNGSVNINDILPDESTIRQNYIDSVYRTTVLKVKLQTVFIPFVGVSVDLWTDSINRNFIGVVSYFISDDFEFKKIVPGISLIEGTKTGKVVYEYTNLLLNLAYEKDQKTIFKFTTDNGSNMVKAFENTVRIRCINHSINLILKSGIGENENLPQIANDLDFCHNLVVDFKRTNKNNKLEHSLKKDVEVRWNINFIMLESIIKSASGIEKILIKDKDFKSAGVLKEVLPRIIEIKDFLEVFKIASDDLSSDTNPLFT